MKSRTAFWRIQLQARHAHLHRLSHVRQFIATTRQRDGVRYEAPGVEEPPTQKASIRSKALAILIGGGIALAYSAYRRGDTVSNVSPNLADGFAIFTLVDKEAVSSTCSIFTLKPLSSKISAGTTVNADGGIYSVQLKQPQLQIARSYTMLPPIPGEPIDTIRLLIRKEEKGEVSGYLHSLALGQDVEIRGPYKDYTFPSDTKQVIFLAGGTGIAPALKTADALGSKADVHVLWASRKREDCAGGMSDTIVQPGILEGIWSWFGGSQSVEKQSTQRNTIVLLLDLLKRRTAHPYLKVDYFVDEEHNQIRPATVSSLLNQSPAADTSKIIFVSGPEGFINYWAGPKVFVDGQEQQGDIGGALSRMNLQGWQVVKL